MWLTTVLDACKPLDSKLQKQKQKITGARGHDLLENRPQKKSYEENQVGDITDSLLKAPDPSDKKEVEAWISRCSWGRVRDITDVLAGDECPYDKRLVAVWTR